MANTRTNSHYAKDLARAAGGSLIFGLPLLMTMEMWYLGFYMDRLRLALFIIAILLMLIGLSNFTGFEKASSWLDNILDSLSAFAIAFVVSALALTLLGVLSLDMRLEEAVGQVAIQSVPGSIGAILARKQLGEHEEPEEDSKVDAGYGAQLFLMTVGALFFAFNVAPTEEMVLIAYQMPPLHAVALAIVSILVLEALVYAVRFAGEDDRPERSVRSTRFLNFTIAGYGIALLVSLYVLWTFGRLDGLSMVQITTVTVVLAFPAAIGAATARIII